MERIGRPSAEAAPAGGFAPLFSRLRAGSSASLREDRCPLDALSSREFTKVSTSCKARYPKWRCCHGRHRNQKADSDSRPGKTYNRNQLLEQIWGGNSEVEERTIDVNVQRLRKILTGPGYEAHIQTVRGFGYRFAVPGQAGGD